MRGTSCDGLLDFDFFSVEEEDEEKGDVTSVVGGAGVDGWEVPLLLLLLFLSLRSPCVLAALAALAALVLAVPQLDSEVSNLALKSSLPVL